MTTVIFKDGILAMDTMGTRHTSYERHPEDDYTDYNIDMIKYRLFPEHNTLICAAGNSFVLSTTDIMTLLQNTEQKDKHETFYVSRSGLSIDHDPDEKSNLILYNWAEDRLETWTRTVTIKDLLWFQRIKKSLTLNYHSNKDKCRLAGIGSGAVVANRANILADEEMNKSLSAIDLVKIAMIHDKHSGGYINYLDFNKFDESIWFDKSSHRVLKAAQVSRAKFPIRKINPYNHGS